MARPSTKPLAEKAVGDVDAQLATWRNEGLSWEAIARRMSAAIGTDISSATCRRWHENAAA